jgi:hypothetical protein
MICKGFVRRLSFACFVALTAGLAFAGDAKFPTGQELPGVDTDYRIVKPAPEPDDKGVPAGTGQFKIGDVDVRISGSITVDVGAGDISAPRR